MPDARPSTSVMGCRLVALAMIGLMLAACADPPRPRNRIGSLPFPGPLTLYAEANPDALGRHHYGLLPRGPLTEWETERGIVYTCRGGFLDLAHVRMTVDWSWYCTQRIERAMRNRRRSVSIVGPDKTRYDLAFVYPVAWNTLDADQRDVLSAEVSRTVGKRLAYIMVTWHELATWFGYKSTGIVPEDGSSFTYDDVIAHLVGVRVADVALQRHDVPFDDAVTEALDAELIHLGALSRTDMRTVIESVKHLWWEDGSALKRQLSVDVLDGELRPWLVPDIDICADAGPDVFRVPFIGEIGGIDFSQFCTIELTPSTSTRARALASIDADVSRLNVRDHLPMVLEAVCADFAELYGEDFADPFKGKPAADDGGGQEVSD